MSQPASVLTAVFPDPPKIYKNKKGAGRPKKAATIAREAGEEQPDVVGELPRVEVTRPDPVFLKAQQPTDADEEVEHFAPTLAEEIKFETDKGKERILAPSPEPRSAPQALRTISEANLVEAPKEDAACVSDGECIDKVYQFADLHNQNEELRSFGQCLSLIGAGMSMAAFVIFRFIL
jgi:hypothetical protein